MAVRAERVPADEVRQRMLDAGRDLALESGAALTIEHLRLEEVIQRARVPRSSVYRLWPYKEEFIDDLLCYLAGAGSWFKSTGVFDPRTFAIVETTVRENRHLLGTPEGRWAVLREATRLGALRNYQAFSESQAWRLHMALVATLGSTRTGEARRRIATALEDSQTRSRKSLVELYEYLLRALGLRLRDPERTAEHLVLAGGILVQSFGLRNIQVQTAAGETGADNVNDLLNLPVPGPGIDGKPAPWSLAAFSYMALLEAFLELDPDWAPPADAAPPANAATPANGDKPADAS
ncbi:MAG: TetR/AcrR family transcriptional regulator [Trebonia sp.]